jgi:hypothetical protein
MDSMTPEERSQFAKAGGSVGATHAPQSSQTRDAATSRMAARDEIHSARMEEFDEKMTQVAAAQLANKEGLRELKATVKSFIEGLHQRGGNGHN